ncbi:MAG: Fic family protein [Eubacterium sp.]|nr:Fic family protein [Eubacterium sp.]
MTQEEAVFLAKRDIVDLIYASARIEGIGVTYPDTNEIYEGRSVAGLAVDDILKINNLKRAWRFVLDDINKTVDLEYIKSLHNILGKQDIINSGMLRRDDVYIGGTNWHPELPNEKHAADIIKNIVNINEPLDSAISMFCYLCRSQLFYDGNKRIAQLMANKILIAEGVGVLRVPDDKQKTFLEILVRFYESDDPSELKDFLKNNAIRSQRFS